MGAIAEGIVAYARPLLDATDGSLEQMNKALAISQVCWNLAILPKGDQEEMLNKLRPSLEMDADEFEEFRQSLLVPMIQRHEEMFPRLQQRRTDSSQNDLWSQERERSAARTEKYPGTDRYAPCPCNSGRKYKFCCGAKGC